ncbi:MAG TPA: phosphorylase [Leptolyngbyaceae cyanobacterium]
MIDAILVPQGVEYKAVCQGLKKIEASSSANSIPSVFAIPIGVKPLSRYLENWLKSGELANIKQPKVLVMGLCGSLSSKYQVGDVVVYQNCMYESDEGLAIAQCDIALTEQIFNKLNPAVYCVSTLTSDRLIYSASQKRRLGDIYGAEVVDMEGFAAVNLLTKANIAVAILRVVSDDCKHNIPNLTSAFSSDGSLKPWPLAIAMLRNPIGAIRLIYGSLRGLQVLEKISTKILPQG